MNVKSSILIVVLALFFSLTNSVARNSISPLQFGLNSAATDVGRYWVLYNTHLEAKKRNIKVDYDAIDTIRIEIPFDAKPIPLTDETDFGNTVFVVKNINKDIYLFDLSNNEKEIVKTSVEVVEKRKKLKQKGSYLLVIEDGEPWVKNREGFNYGHNRRDIVYVDEGKVRGTVTSTYGTSGSKPRFTKIPASKSQKNIKNIQFIRDSTSTYKTFSFYVENQYNVKISNVCLNTSPSNLYGDVAIKLINCYKVKFTNITINGTYSQNDAYGYGISMDNVSDVLIDGLKAKAKWGIFGNNNINNVKLKNCDINRFDVHCYGKDIYFDNCIFRDLYNQFSSMYGTVSFKNCEFVNSTPVLFESSYNAYTKFKLVIKNCVVYASSHRCSLIHGGNLNGKLTTGREEIRQQEYPDIYIKGLTVYLPDGLTDFYMYNTRKGVLKWPNDNIPCLRRVKNFRVVSGK